MMPVTLILLSALVVPASPVDAVVFVDPCNGNQEIVGSSFFVVCPQNSHACGSDLWHIWGLWQDCCCDTGRAYWLVGEGTWECATCFSNATEPRDGPVYSDRPLPAWWARLHLPQPAWVRIHLSSCLIFLVVPNILRAGGLWALGSVLGMLCKKLTGYDQWNRFLSQLCSGVQDCEKRIVLVGALAYIEYSGQQPGKGRVKHVTQADIKSHESYGQGVRQSLDKYPTKIKLMAPDISRMGFTETSLAMSYPWLLAYCSAAMHLIGWHLLQVVMYTAAFLSVADLVDDYQFTLALLAASREVLYLFLIVIGIFQRPAYLLYHPVREWQTGPEGRELDVLSYILQPEKWIIKMLYVNVTKPWHYYAVLTLSFVLDVFGCISLIYGLRSHRLPWPLAICYSVIGVSCGFFVVIAIRTSFFIQVRRPIEHEDAWNGHWLREMVQKMQDPADILKSGFNVEALEAAGLSLSAFRQYGYQLPQLEMMGFGLYQLREAGYSLRDLVEAGAELPGLQQVGFRAVDFKHANFLAVELAQQGLLKSFPVCDLRGAGYPADELRDVGLTVAELVGGGFRAKELREAKVPTKEVVKHFRISDLLEAGYTARDLRRLDIVSELLDEQQGTIASNLKYMGGWISRTFRGPP